jgi:hypothetical protein
MQSARLNLVQEGGQWKIDLPDSIDGKQLAQNIQKHVDMAVQQKDQWGSDAQQAQRSIAQHILMAFSDQKESGQGSRSGASGAGSSSDSSAGGTGSSNSANSGAGSSNSSSNSDTSSSPQR